MSTFKQLLMQNGSVSIHQRNLQIIATEIFKTKNCWNSAIKKDVFKFKNLTYNFRNAENLNRSNVNFIKYGTETITYLVVKIWKILPNGYKDLTSLISFKYKIKNWEANGNVYPARWFYLIGHCYFRSVFVEHFH